MIAGAGIGHAWPAAADHLRLLSLIFLNLIRTIIAPLLFSTLVVGIAGHSNLRQIGFAQASHIDAFEVVIPAARPIETAENCHESRFA